MDRVERDHALVSAADVAGTDVYGTGGIKVGTVDRVMIDKLSGKVAYAVVSFGGFLGIGEEERPIPWNTLDYDPVLGGFRTAITEAQLRDAPPARSDWVADRDWEERLHGVFGVQPYWI